MRTMELGFAGTPLRRQPVDAVLRGEKTATDGLLVDYEREDEPLPSVGDRSLLLDEDDVGVAVVEVTDVHVLRVADCELAFARDEGEGFEPVAAWREAHEGFWRGYADDIRADLDDPGWDVTERHALRRRAVPGRGAALTRQLGR